MRSVGFLTSSRSSRNVALSVSLLVFVTSTFFLMLCGGCIERKPERLARRESPVTSDLKDMVKAQADMKSDPDVDSETYRQTMAVFRNRVYDLVAQALIREPEDLERAARVLLACDLAGDHADCLLAFYLAKHASDKGLANARPLAARCVDRYLVSTGKPQRFGTQMVTDSLGRQQLAPVDTGTSDSERAAWGLPPLNELMQQGAAGVR